MKTILNGSWLAFLLLSTPGLMAQNTNQNFSWTVIGTGTETWNVMNYNTAELTVWSADYPGLNPAADSVTVTAGLTGKANFSASLDSSFGGTTYASISPSIWSDETDTGVLRADNGTFEATAGTTYTLYAYCTANSTGGGGVNMEVAVPGTSQAKTATRTASENGANLVSEAPRQNNLGGFEATPQPQNGGTISGTIYTLTWNNTNAAVFFSDTRSTNTTDPNANILAVATAAEYICTTNSDNTLTITSYIGPEEGGVVNVPANINGMAVAGIGSGAFSNDCILTSLTIPVGVTSIGDFAFDSCLALTNVILPDSVTSIGDYAFASTELTDVILPNRITTIGSYAFTGCPLANVTIPGSVTNLGDYAFYYCSWLTNVVIANGLIHIGNGVFCACWDVTSVTLPASVTSIGAGAFTACLRLTNIAVNAANPDYANAGGVLFNKSMTTLIQYPCGLHALSYAIPSSVTAIGDEAFEECTSLNSITLPTGITSIGARAFAWCPGLTNIYCQGNLPGFDSTAIAGDSLSQMTFYYLPGTTGWSRLSAYGLRIVPWYLPNPLISNYGPGFGVQTNAFGFTISWATNLAVVVEACTNLANPVWQPVQTNTLVGGTAAFSDPLWNAHPSRFYRLLAAP